MCAKYAKKNKMPLGIIALVIILAVVCGAVYLMLQEPADAPEVPTPSSTAASDAAATDMPAETGDAPARLDELDEVSIALDFGMCITDVGKYTGIYMEDGSDEIVSGIMMIAVTNKGENDIQYAEIAMPVGGQTAHFSLTTLPVDATVILLEKDRMEYVPGDYTTAEVSSVALFQYPLTLCEDRLRIQILDGAINVTNISGADITGDIVIYYKNSAADVYYGGITYRVRLEGGLKAGEIRQIMASHFSAAGSSIMFVTCGDN